jgi:hypothetical protein
MNAIDLECPECGAKPGERCHTLTGKATPVSHGKRKRAAFEQEALRQDNSQRDAQIATNDTEKT